MFSTLLRLESEDALDRVLQAPEEFLSITKDVYDKDGIERRRAEIERICDELRLDDMTKARVTDLVQKWKVRRTDWDNSLLWYFSHLDSEFHPLTWKEFYDAREQYDPNAGSRLSNRLNEYARERRVSVEDITSDFLDRLITYREEMVARAADEPVLADARRYLEDASKVHVLMRTLVLDGLPSVAVNRLSTPAVFERLLAQALKWIHFVNDGHEALRIAERELLLEIAGRPLPDPRKWLSVVWSPRGLTPLITSNPYAPEKQAELRKELQRRLFPQAEDQALTMFHIHHGLYRVFSDPGAVPLRYVLFFPDSSIWQGSGYQKLLNVLDEARSSSLVQENCHVYLNFLVSPNRAELPVTLSQQLVELLAKNGFLARLWTATVSRPIQTRWHVELNKLRSELVKVGVADSELPCPKWLTLEPQSSPTGDAAAQMNP